MTDRAKAKCAGPSDCQDISLGHPSFEEICANQDSILISEGYATVTPLQFDFTAYNQLENVGGWDL